MKKDWIRVAPIIVGVVVICSAPVAFAAASHNTPQAASLDAVESSAPVSPFVSDSPVAVESSSAPVSPTAIPSSPSASETVVASSSAPVPTDAPSSSAPVVSDSPTATPKPTDTPVALPAPSDSVFADPFSPPTSVTVTSSGLVTWAAPSSSSNIVSYLVIATVSDNGGAGKYVAASIPATTFSYQLPGFNPTLEAMGSVAAQTDGGLTIAAHFELVPSS